MKASFHLIQKKKLNNGKLFDEVTRDTQGRVPKKMWKIIHALYFNNFNFRNCFLVESPTLSWTNGKCD